MLVYMYIYIYKYSFTKKIYSQYKITFITKYAHYTHLYRKQNFPET